MMMMRLVSLNLAVVGGKEVIFVGREGGEEVEVDEVGLEVQLEEEKLKNLNANSRSSSGAHRPRTNLSFHHLPYPVLNQLHHPRSKLHLCQNQKDHLYHNRESYRSIILILVLRLLWMSLSNVVGEGEVGVEVGMVEDLEVLRLIEVDSIIIIIEVVDMVGMETTIGVGEVDLGIMNMGSAEEVDSVIMMWAVEVGVADREADQAEAVSHFFEDLALQTSHRRLVLPRQWDSAPHHRPHGPLDSIHLRLVHQVLRCITITIILHHHHYHLVIRTIVTMHRGRLHLMNHPG